MNVNTNTGSISMGGWASPSKAVPLQTPSEVKDEDEGPLQVDSSPPGSPDSTSSMSDDSREPPVSCTC